MLRRMTALFLTLLLLAPLLTRGEELAELDAYVDSAFKASKTVGGSLIISKGEDIVYARDWGYKDLRNKLPVDENTYFRTASITKMITGIGIMRLVDMGLLDLDADISTYFGYKIASGRYPAIPLTLRQLMSHTSSISDNGGYSRSGNKVSEMLAAVHDRRGNFTGKRPGAAYSYSNLGAGVTGSIIEAVTNMSIDTFMRGAVFEPLNIEASYSPSRLTNHGDVSNQYRLGKLDRAASGALAKPLEDFADPENHYMITIGNVWIRSRDMAKLAALLCGDGSYAGTRIISSDSIYEMRREQMELGKSVTGPSPYGLFLEHNDTLLPDKMVYGHQGMSNGAILNCYFEPESGFSMVLFSNGGSQARSNRVGLLARKFFSYFYELYN